jgi:hypothetical protein
MFYLLSILALIYNVCIKNKQVYKIRPVYFSA